MPEARLAKTRRSLPEGYQFGNGKFPREVFRAPCGCREVETRPGASSLYACSDHEQGEQAYEAICIAKYVTPAYEALADRVSSGKVLPMDVPILRAMGWNVIEGEHFGVDLAHPSDADRHPVQEGERVE